MSVADRHDHVWRLSREAEDSQPSRLTRWHYKSADSCRKCVRNAELRVLTSMRRKRLCHIAGAIIAVSAWGCAATVVGDAGRAVSKTTVGGDSTVPPGDPDGAATPSDVDNANGGDAPAATPGDTNAFADGSSAAAVKATGPQHPTWLDDEPHRPAWRVAGIDYAVGINDSALPLKDPSVAGNLPAGASYADGTVTVTQDNIHLDGFDFSAVNGFIDTTAANGTLITNSKFGFSSYGPYAAPIIFGDHYTVRYCEIDADNLDTDGFVAPFSAYPDQSNVTFEYNWIQNTRSDMFSMAGGVQTYRYNLLENIGVHFPIVSGKPDPNGPHPDFFQWDGASNSVPVTATIAFNTMLQNCKTIGGDAQGTYMANTIFGPFIVANNIMRVSPGATPVGYDSDGLGLQVLWWVGGTGGGSSLATGAPQAQINENYVDISVSTTGFNYGGGDQVFSGNINMQSGAVLDGSL